MLPAFWTNAEFEIVGRYQRFRVISRLEKLVRALNAPFSMKHIKLISSPIYGKHQFGKHEDVVIASLVYLVYAL